MSHGLIAIVIVEHVVFIFFVHSDYSSFVDEMMGLISNNELGKDVASAEALLERHSERKVSVMF